MSRRDEVLKARYAITPLDTGRRTVALVATTRTSAVTRASSGPTSCSSGRPRPLDPRPARPARTVADLPTHEDIERTIGSALARLGAAPVALEPETTFASLGLNATCAAALASALNERYQLELTAGDCATQDVRTIADLVLLVRLYLIHRALEIA
jgi:Phosphopantetheine attachment site